MTSPVSSIIVVGAVTVPSIFFAAEQFSMAIGNLINGKPVDSATITNAVLQLTVTLMVSGTLIVILSGILMLLISIIELVETKFGTLKESDNTSGTTIDITGRNNENITLDLTDADAVVKKLKEIS